MGEGDVLGTVGAILLVLSYLSCLHFHLSRVVLAVRY
jgi:hypothetical protein